MDNKQNNLTDNKNPKRSRPAGATVTIRDMLSIVAVILVSTIAVLFIALNFNANESTIAIEDRYRDFGNNWRVQVGDRDEIVSLPAHIHAGPNESIIMSKELPKLSQYYAVVTRNYHQRLVAYVDGEVIYEFPSPSKIIDNAIITDDWNTIRLKEDMTGHTFTLELKTGNYGFNGSIQPLYLGEDNSLVQYIRSSTALSYGMAVSVLALGVVLIVLGIVYSKYNEDRSQVIAGLMLVAIGIWVTNRSKMPLLLVGSSVKYYLSFISLMLESILILLYTGEKFKNKNRKLTTRLLVGFSIFLLAVVGLVHIFKLPVDQAVPFAYAAIFFSSLYLIIMLWPTSFGKESANLSTFVRRSNRIEFVATNVMVWGVVLSIVIDFILGNDRLWTDVGVLSKISLNVYAVGQLLVHIYRSYHNVEVRDELQGKLHDSQMELMMGQIQPHFIFNTLSSIRTLVKVDPDTAYNMIYDFSNYLRANVDNVTNLDGINFASEVEHIKSYVNIERVRFGDRLNMEYDIQASNFIVPPLSIQPLVENAIKHGVTKKIGGGTVWLRSYEEGNYNVVEVEDNGMGFTPERLIEITQSMTQERSSYDEYESEAQANLTGNGSEKHKSSAMRNIYLRLKEMANAEMEFTSKEGEGTKVRVLFPKQELQEQ